MTMMPRPDRRTIAGEMQPGVALSTRPLPVVGAPLAIDLAILGNLLDDPLSPDALCTYVQATCHPWLRPTGCVVGDRLTAALTDGFLVHRPDGDLALTEHGETRLRSLVAVPLTSPCQGLVYLLESLKVALLDTLDAPTRRAVLDDLISQRHRRAHLNLAVTAPRLASRCSTWNRQREALVDGALQRAAAGQD